MNLGGAVVPEGPPTVVRDEQLGTQHVDAVDIAGIDANLRVVHRARVRVGHLLPGIAAVEGTERLQIQFLAFFLLSD